MSVVERTNVTAREIVVVDVFCGAGGLTHGFVKEGIEVAAGLDSDASCQYAYERNNDGAKFLHRKIEDVRSSTRARASLAVADHGYLVIIDILAENALAYIDALTATLKTCAPRIASRGAAQREGPRSPARTPEPRSMWRS